MDNLFVLPDVAPYTTRVGAITPGTTTIRDLQSGVVELAEDSIGFINEAGVTIPLATGANTAAIDALVKNTKKFALILGTATSTPLISDWIDRENARAEMQAYCAPVWQTSYIGSDGTNGNDLNTVITWANVIGHELKFAIVRTDRDYPNIQPGDTWNFTHTIGSTVVATEVANLVALINNRNDNNFPVVASVVAGNKGILLTNKQFYTSVKIIFPSDLFYNGNMGIATELNELIRAGALQFGAGISTNPYVGCGLPFAIKEYEDLAYATKGRQDTYREAPYDEQAIWTRPSKVSFISTCGYNQTIIQWNKDNIRSAYRQGKEVTQKLVIAMALAVNATTKAVTGYGSNLTLAIQDRINLTFDVLLQEARTVAGTVESGETTAGQGTA